MHSDPKAIFRAALKLSEADRLELATRLLETVRAPGINLSLDDPDLEAELDRRSADQSGHIPWSEIRREGRQS